MASTSETGHSKNVANFEELYSICRQMGSRFSPMNQQITLGALSTKLVDSQNALSDTITQASALVRAIKARRDDAETLEDLAPRLVAMLESSNTPEDIIKKVNTLKNKLLGRSKSQKPEQASAPSSTAEANLSQVPSENSISTIQASFDKKLEHFEKIIQLLATEPSYNPSEQEFSLAGLNALLTSLRQKNTNLDQMHTVYKDVLRQRNQTIYAPDGGLVDLAGKTKAYVKSLFGLKSPEYMHINSVKFHAGIRL
jgi:DNA repair exonuclease SbcCD ATPase subunit